MPRNSISERCRHAKLTLTDWTGEPTKAEHERLQIRFELVRSFAPALVIFPIWTLSYLWAPGSGLVACCIAAMTSTVAVAVSVIGFYCCVDRHQFTRTAKAMMDLRSLRLGC